MRSSEKSMESRVYDRMDWSEIEAVVYAEEDRPRRILGPHVTDDGILVQAFFPGRENVSIRSGGKTIPMVQEDEAGYFAVMLNGKKIPPYDFILEDEPDQGKAVKDPYAYPCQITEKDETRFVNGISAHAFEKLGAHRMTINGADGVYFAVWAPNAVRVSVVGDFNGWDGRLHQMNRLESGIFEVFVPDVGDGSFYKYEIKTKAGLVYLKPDPCGFAFQQGNGGASIVTDITHEWKDADWIAGREVKDVGSAPMAVYELNISTWKRREDGSAYTYAEIAPQVADYVKSMGYTHVELMPVMEYPDDESMGYATSGFFAPTGRCGTPQDFFSFMETMHAAGIGVILDWVPGCFARGNEGLASFDGTCLYEHLDPKKGVHPFSGSLIFNYGRGEVCSFLISSAMFWLTTYHADGLRINDVATMVYLDYGRKAGQWIANMYGGNENLEAIAFLKNLNQTIHREFPGVITAAEEETGFPQVTGSVSGGGLGFDYKWNNGCIHDYMNYIQLDPLFRGAHQDDLTFSSVYMYSEKFILALSHDLLSDGGKALISKMPGAKPELKMANLRLTYAYLMTHPGKKLITMGQDFAQRSPETAAGGVRWEEADTPEGRQMTAFTRALLKLYHSQPALYQLDENPEGFEWISNLDWERNMLVYLRKSMKTEETLLIVANFSNVTYENFMVGVPYPGKYKEIFTSDSEEFGGTGVTNPRVKLSRAVEQDERRDSIKIRVAPLAVAVYRFTEPVIRMTSEHGKETEAPAPAVKSRKADGEASGKAGKAQTETADKPKKAQTGAVKTKKTSKSSASGTKKAKSTASDTAKKAKTTAADTAKKIGTAAADTAKKVQTAAADTAKKVQTAAADTAKKVETAAADTAKRVETAAADTAKKVQTAAADTAKKVETAATDTAKKVQSAANKAKKTQK